MLDVTLSGIYNFYQISLDSLWPGRNSTGRTDMSYVYWSGLRLVYFSAACTEFISLLGGHISASPVISNNMRHPDPPCSLPLWITSLWGALWHMNLSSTLASCSRVGYCTLFGKYLWITIKNNLHHRRWNYHMIHEFIVQFHSKWVLVEVFIISKCDYFANIISTFVINDGVNKMVITKSALYNTWLSMNIW